MLNIDKKFKPNLAPSLVKKFHSNTYVYDPYDAYHTFYYFIVYFVLMFFFYRTPVSFDRMKILLLFLLIRPTQIVHFFFGSIHDDIPIFNGYPLSTH